jgi:MFS transporter, Spinster family, sphingosine-1-phosphate transporter
MSDISQPYNGETASAKRTSRSYPTYVFWIMFAISFLNYLDRYVLTGAANTIAHELHFGVDGIGYVASAFLVVYTLVTVPLGIIADRTKRKNVIAVCVTFWSIATALTALSFNFLSLFFFRMLLGVGEAGYFPAGTAMMGDYFSSAKRSRIMSWWSVAQLVGILLGFVLGGELAGIYAGSWRLAFLFTGIPGLILAFLAWKLREPRRNQADLEEEVNAREGGVEVYPSGEGLPEASAEIYPPTPANPLLQMGRLLRIKTLVVLIVMQIFAYFVLSVATTFLPTYLQQKDLFGLTSGFAGLFSGGVIVLAGLIGTVFGGYLADWLNSRHAGSRVLVCGIGFLISAPTFALSVLSHSFGLFALFFIITTILITFYTGPSTAATQDVAPAALRASAVAVSLLIAHLLGDAFSPTLIGVLARVFDPTGGTHFAQNMAGHDLAFAMLITCTPALVIAGLVGLFGARWMKGDVAAAQEADRIAKQSAA